MGGYNTVGAHRLLFDDPPGATAAPIRPITDAELVALFGDDPERAWAVFLERYADIILAELRLRSLAHDPLMDGFVYVCEKLSERGFRRLRSIKRLGDRGDLTPWLRTVVRNLATSFGWQRSGRKRLLRSVERLPALEQEVFRWYFWHGLKPSEICERLRRAPTRRATTRRATSLVEVLDALETLFAHLSEQRVWHLVAGLAAARVPESLDEPSGATPPIRAAGPNPEEEVIHGEALARLDEGLTTLPPRQRLVVRLRYDDHLAVTEIAAILGVTRRQVHRLLGTALDRLRREVIPADGETDP